MMKIWALIIFSTLLTNNAFSEEICIHCGNYFEQVGCTEETVSLYRVQMASVKQQIKDRFYKKPNINKLELKEEMNSYIGGINQLRSCERSLGKNKTRCSLSIIERNALPNNLYQEIFISEIGERDNQCQTVPVIDREEIINSEDKTIAYRLKNHWILPFQKTTCVANDPNRTPTTRSIQLGGYDPKYQKSSYILAIDWTDGEINYPVSAHWGKRANLGRSPLSVESNDEGLLFSWENGADVLIDYSTGEIMRSNIIEEKVFNENECRTKSSVYGSKRRFYPDFKLTPRFNSIRISTSKG